MQSTYTESRQGLKLQVRDKHSEAHRTVQSAMLGSLPSSQRDRNMDELSPLERDRWQVCMEFPHWRAEQIWGRTVQLKSL